MKGKLYYCCYFSNHEENRRRDAVPAADLQVSYLSELFRDIGYEVEVIGLNIPEKTERIFRIQKGFVKEIDNNMKVRYFTCLESNIRLLRRISRRLIYFSASRYLKSLNSDAPLIMYHSRIFYPYYAMLKKRRQRYILELEEIYSDVIGDEKLRKEEIENVKKANAYILPSVPLAEEISHSKKWVLYHGSCRREKALRRGVGDGRIHIVYAGTFDYRVVGDMSMIYAAKYLDDNYHIHIIGFGNEIDKKRITDAIADVKECQCKVTYDGLLLGDEYLKFLQDCDVGIFSRDPNSKDINSSFPSKIMSYLSNGLRVIATRTDSIERSDVADLMYFVDSNDPKEVADTIMGIDFSDDYDSRNALKKLEVSLKERMNRFLSDYKEEADYG